MGRWYDRVRAIWSLGPPIETYMSRRGLALGELAAAHDALHEEARAVDDTLMDSPEMMALLSAAAVLLRAIALELRARRSLRDASEEDRRVRPTT